MQNENDITREKGIKTVSIIGVIANVFLLGIKGVIGFISGSQAMIADSLNSAGDIFASFMSYVGAKLALKPKDKNHPYGHGRAKKCSHFPSGHRRFLFLVWRGLSFLYLGSSGSGGVTAQYEFLWHGQPPAAAIAVLRCAEDV